MSQEVARGSKEVPRRHAGLMDPACLRGHTFPDGFGEALGGFGEALGRLWEPLGMLWGDFGKALGKLWAGFGRLWAGNESKKESKHRQKEIPLYIKNA